MKTHCPTVLAIVLVSLLLSGCAGISTDYGKTKGATGRTSLNGFGALRSAYENAGFRDRDVTRLSDRVMRTHVIVWTPQMLSPVDGRVTKWFDRWLRRGNRTLVYIVPDSGSEADYWIDTARIAPPEQRLEYRKRAAKSVNQRMLWRLNRANVQSNGWFRIEALEHRRKLGEIAGPWAQDLGKLSEDDKNIETEFLVVAYDKKQATATTAPVITAGPTGPASPGWSFPLDTSPTTTPITYRELVRTEAGDPLVAQIESKNWKDSRIIVVAGGSLLTNYAFTRPFNRRLADRIIAESTPVGDVTDPGAGFLTSSWNQIPVSEREPGVPKASGMELLTVWPISLVTMHGVMLGLVICLMLLPVFGRPRRIRRAKSSDFGHHLDAVAALMNKSGGEPYARARISEYMRRMHGETSGPWVLPEVGGHGLKTSLPRRSSRNAAATDAAPPKPEPSPSTAAPPSAAAPQSNAAPPSAVASQTAPRPPQADTTAPESNLNVSQQQLPDDEAER